MDNFFSKEEVHRFKDAFIAANVKKEDFFNLNVETLVNILGENMNDIALFLPFYNAEKKNYAEIEAVVLNGSCNNDLNMSWSEEVIQNTNEEIQSSGNDSLPSSTNVIVITEETDVVGDLNIDEDLIVEEVETSTHNNVPDNFEFVENSLYFLLNSTIEGRIILGMYKKSKILLERRLKIFVIQNYITENPVTYKISKKRFEEIRSQIAELFPTVNPKDWYEGHRTNAHGQHVSASGCLINFFKTYRKDLALAGILNFPDPANTSSNISINNEPTAEVNLAPLTDTDRSKYVLGTVLKVWDDSFDKRLQELVLKKNKKVCIRSETYFNTFVCLHSSSGVELLISDSNLIIQRLVKANAIPKKVADNFQTIFCTRWDALAPLICKQGDLSQISDIKLFRSTHKNYINNVSKPVLALLYAAYFLTKTFSVATKETGTFTFSRNACVEHFIAFIENESLLEAYKLNLKKTFTDLGLTLSPYVIFCGKLDNITKAFVVINHIHYEIKDPLQAVEACLKASIALHSWTTTCVNVWLYLLEHVYSIRPNTSCAFPPAKSTRTISSFIKKVDPTFTTLETSDAAI